MSFVIGPYDERRDAAEEEGEQSCRGSFLVAWISHKWWTDDGEKESMKGAFINDLSKIVRCLDPTHCC